MRAPECPARLNPKPCSRDQVVIRLCKHVFHAACLRDYAHSLAERRDQVIHGATYDAPTELSY